MHAFLNADKRVRIEQRQARLTLRDDDHAGAPPRTGIDLDGGTALIPPRRWPRTGSPEPAGQGHAPWRRVEWRSASRDEIVTGSKTHQKGSKCPRSPPRTRPARRAGSI
ncbi:DUF6191 domain-containing protein [Streptomyces sp. LS1784]|uniref:DUF6191 domain-containing protein n=1 Tax=Streptomyces sp. LS1784 TaxID=2851533 RepID=UPI001CCEA790